MGASLQPIIKWPGGKEKELSYIIPNIPSFEKYYEPFVGGGSVFMALDASEYHINDLSNELISLYNNIATCNNSFYKYVEDIDQSWKNAEELIHIDCSLVSLYRAFREATINKTDLQHQIHSYCEKNIVAINSLLVGEFSIMPSILVEELEKNLCRKMVRMRCLEIEKSILPDKDVFDNIEAAIKSAIYMNYRNLYNNQNISLHKKDMHNALFFFIRNYAYSGMFRYSSKGDFNVPYGGIAYNSKSLAKKVDYYKSMQVQKHFANTKIYNLDFEEFLVNSNPSEHDFIFLDPPYDSEFSTYAQNNFTRIDHIRLANYLINKCQAKWMLVIKNTDFIYSLYNVQGINIQIFDKEYIVSFMNRNDRKTTHLLITNY